MWKQMLKTELLEIRMDESNRLFEVQISGSKKHAMPAVRLGQADLMELIQTLLEINRVFRGDVPYYATCETTNQSAHSFVDEQERTKVPDNAKKSTTTSMHASSEGASFLGSNPSA
ncbi:hypothetical protein ACFQZT_17600 [Paenibacillus sp. GCM10027628]|uniref:hypothetical protein n=1 Tax=Paenibacillus sp. GCM10027628 TaxID=3273413 RepID=UPI00362BB8B8